jgi:hypothetical protein
MKFLSGKSLESTATDLPIAQVLLSSNRVRLNLATGNPTGNPKSLIKRPAFEQLHAWCNSKVRFGKYTAEMENEKAVA